MKGKYLRAIGGFIFATLMLAGTLFVSSGTVEAQHRRRVIICSTVPLSNLQAVWIRPLGLSLGLSRV